MTPNPTQDHSALRWIRGELDETLRQARLQLEDYVEEEIDSLERCVAYLHQVRGSLDMVQVYGGAMLSNELEVLAAAIGNQEVPRKEAAVEVLMMGMVQLPAYLERIEGGEPDIPLILLPLMNDLRAARNAPLVSEISLFAPKLDSVILGEEVVLGSGNPALPELLREQRAHYHRGLLNWYRDVDAKLGLSQIRDVIEHVAGEARIPRVRRLLDASEALVVALAEESLESSVAVKLLFGQLDRVFKRIIDEGEEAAARAFPLELLKNQLYYIARSDSDDPIVQAVRRSADLANSFPDISMDDVKSGELGGPGKALFEAVGGALKTDLRGVKDHLDLYMRGSRDDFERLGGLVDPIRRIADTLGMVGRGELRSRLVPDCEAVEQAIKTQTVPTDDQLMKLAGNLLFVESALLALGDKPMSLPAVEGSDEAPLLQAMSEGEFREHVHAAISQAFVEMAKIKDAILQFLEDSQKITWLDEIPNRLHDVAGALTIMEQAQAASLLEDLGNYIRRLSSGEAQVPDQDQRELIADLVSGIEFHMESVVDRRPDHGHALRVAQAASVRLGLTSADTLDDDLQIDADDDILPLPEVLDVPAEFEQVEAQVADLAAAEHETGASAPQPSAASEPAARPEVPVASAAKPALEDIDSEILEIFIEEAREELDAIREHFPQWRDDRQAQESLTRVRRSFHTLKGSGRLVGASEIGEFAWSVENLLNRVIDGTVEANGEVIDLIEQVIEVLPALIDERERGDQVGTSVSHLEERAFLLASPAVSESRAEPTPEPAAEPVAEPDAEDSAEPVAEAAAEAETAEQTQPADTPVDESAAEEQAEEAQAEEAPADELAVDIADVAEVIELAPVSELPEADELEDLEPDSQPLENVDSSSLDITDEQLEEAFLESDSAELHSEEIELEGLLDDSEDSLDIDSILSSEAPPNEVPPKAADAANDSAAPASEPLEAVSSELVLEDDESDSLLQIDESILTPESESNAPIELESTLFDIYTNESQVHLAAIAAFVEHCRGRANGCLFSEDLSRALHTLRGSSHMAEVEPVAALAGSFEKWVNLAQRLEQHTDQASIDLLERGHFVIGSLVQVINRAGANVPSWQPLQKEVEQRFADLEKHLQDEETADSELAEAPEQDDELIEIFLEEAHELSEALEHDFEQWRKRPDDLLPVAQLQRHLHTIKGGARLAGLSGLGDLSHALESLFESVVEQRIDSGEGQRNLVRFALDGLAMQIDALDNSRPLQDMSGVIERLEAASRGEAWEPVGAMQPEPVPSEADEPSVDASTESLDQDTTDASTMMVESTLLRDSNLLTDSELLSGDSDFAPTSMLLGEVGDGGDPSSMLSEDSRIIQFPARGRHAEQGEEELPERRPPPPEEPQAKPKASQENVRVRADLIDQMVNNAGEVSIYRARLEQQGKTQSFNLEELSQTIERLRAQLRSLELETEAQILSRYEREYEGEIPQGFDPLEMDRYSTIQQLSRALSETVNDLSNIGVTLHELSRDSDTLLLQQERVTNDLQDGLLRTRMVPVASRTARLQRVVRQTAQSLGKQAELVIQGGQGEMDRAILERMMAPLEHLLRNAVAHGIESPEQREDAGKSGVGEVSLVMSREGSDVVLTINDDGAGFDREAIRAKALERGLIDEQAHVEDGDLDQFVLEAGFSTADAVSQIAGRGVGMDVVLSEVKQLGGSLDIASTPGQGASFSIRLPFTLAITESLLVHAGDEVYAVPHSAMDGVVRIPRADLEAIYRGDAETFTYGGRDYSVRYLGSMLSNARPQLPEGERWFPLLLVRSGEHRVAIHVDGLLGNRQIVVKSVGAQLSTVRWFTGGTILADGRIALILDVNSLVRMDSAQHQPQMLESDDQAQPGNVKVMVVDDSITVRKVTSRLLERHNMQVITAKDGVDAVAVLQEEHPDVMLLDIEMPRMDGFELARHMRSSEQLSDIPIIMITSRTGDKHRNLAMELGVKRYLGKPYQESDLLENIYTVLAEAGDE